MSKGEFWAENAIAELNKISSYESDVEMQHVYADDVLCKLLNNLGYAEVVEAWKRVPKWYA